MAIVYDGTVAVVDTGRAPERALDATSLCLLDVPGGWAPLPRNAGPGHVPVVV
ncbi:hypothetical protein IPZ58_15745 [Streptomyces roseoverticillatus]|uniref:hypothetical protein n=1 Tax=Streptomyces roseoverticillatus TaxID=66429 RepID=UPI001F3FEB83|nr:hypothetical protein [Streptomyces roseoverticillatus]MCF3103028.1 hypothetical protein [Streptomyces roseoverticillatus]